MRNMASEQKRSNSWSAPSTWSRERDLDAARLLVQRLHRVDLVLQVSVGLLDLDEVVLGLVGAVLCVAHALHVLLDLLDEDAVLALKLGDLGRGDGQRCGGRAGSVRFRHGGQVVVALLELGHLRAQGLELSACGGELRLQRGLTRFWPGA